MNGAAKIASAAVTVAGLAGAVVLGGGVPRTPAEIASSTERALDNVTTAERNTSLAARDTRALAEIADNVRSQLDTSRRMLSIQLEIEESTRGTAEQAGDLRGALDRVADALESVEGRLRKLARLSAQSGEVSESAVDAAEALTDRLSVLRARYAVVVRESRELNRKARGYEQLRNPP